MCALVCHTLCIHTVCAHTINWLAEYLDRRGSKVTYEICHTKMLYVDIAYLPSAPMSYMLGPFIPGTTFM